MCRMRGIHVVQLLLLLFKLAGLNGSCIQVRGSPGEYRCTGNDTTGVLPNATTLTINLGGSGIDLSAMKNLTELTSLQFLSPGFRVFQSSDFAIFPKLKELILLKPDGDFGPLRILNLTGGLDALEKLQITRQNLQANVAEANFDTIPHLKVLSLGHCNLTDFRISGVISNLRELNLYLNPHLGVDSLPYEKFNNLTNLRLLKNRFDPRKLKQLPQSLTDLTISVEQEPRSEDFVNLTQLRRLQVMTTIDINFTDTFATLPLLKELKLDYVDTTTTNVSLSISNCPVGLSKVEVFAPQNDVGLIEVYTSNNTCSNSLELKLTSLRPCDCGLYTKLRSAVGKLVYHCSMYFRRAADVCKPAPTVPSVKSSGVSVCQFPWVAMFLTVLIVLVMEME